MARPRIKQFAGDMGISYDEANNLIKKSRGRRDGGSQVLESYMRNAPDMPKKKKKKRSPGRGVTASQRPGEHLSEIKLGRGRSVYADEEQMKSLRRQTPTEKAMGGTVYAEDGKYMSCRGMGAAIKGGKFSGCK